VTLQATVIRAKIEQMSEPTPAPAQRPPKQAWNLERLPWLWLGLLFVVLLFTPLGRLWPLAWMVVGAGVLLENLSSRDALVFASTAIIAGSFSVGNWTDLISPNPPALENEAAEIQFVPLEGVRRIELRTFNGSIKILNAPGPARLTVRRKGGVNVRSETIGELFSVQAKRPFFAWNTAVNLELTLPTPKPFEPGLSFALITSNGPIEVNAKADRIEASTSGARILIQDTGTKSMQLNNSNAPIEINNASGSLLASTSNAMIRINEAKDLSLNLENSNGAIRLERLQLATNSRSSVRTSNAAIDLIAIRAPAGLSFKGETANAKLDVTLPGFELKLEGQRFEAKQNGLGIAELELETANAPINIKP
jgi:hypothetical protein